METTSEHQINSPHPTAGLAHTGQQREALTTDAHDWKTVTAGSLIANQHVVTIEGSIPVENACETLISNNISSAPVYELADAFGSSADTVVRKRSYIGMFDYGDLLTYLLIILHKMEVPADDQTVEIKELVRRAYGGQSVPVKLASDLSRKNPFYSVLPDATLASVVEEFACGTHRVAVMDGDGDIKGILSQSAVVAYLSKHINKFPQLEPVFDQSLRELGLGASPVISVNSESWVLEALTLMSKNGVSSLAVVDAMGLLHGNISMSDVKYIMKSYRYSLLSLTCYQFVNEVRRKQGVEDGQDRYPVFDVPADCKLGYAIAKLIATKAHRVWCIDERGKVVGVVSLTDVLRVFARSSGITVSEVRRASFAVGWKLGSQNGDSPLSGSDAMAE